MGKIYSKTEVDAILNKHFGFSEREAVNSVDAKTVEKEGILTVTAIGLVEGILNNYRELSLSETWKPSLANDIIVNPEHTNKFLEVLSFDGKATVGKHTLTKKDFVSAFSDTKISEATGIEVNTFDVSFEIELAENPKFYDIAKRGKLKNWSITSYDTFKLCANPDFVDWASKEAYDNYKKYAPKVIYPNVKEIDYFYVITSTHIVGISPVLFPSQRMALTSVVNERSPQEIDELTPNISYLKQLQAIADNNK